MLAPTNKGDTKMKVKPCDWLKQRAFWFVGLNYMMTRLVANVSQVYIVFFLVDRLSLPNSAMASAPLTVFIASFLATSPQKRLFNAVGRKGAYCVGAVFGLAAATGFYFVTAATAKWVYFVAVLLGIANATLMVSSVSLEADLVGDNVESGAFIYGAMSLTDKLSNGAAVMLIQSARHTLSTRGVSDAGLLRGVMGPGLGAVVAVALAGLVFLPNFAATGDKPAAEENGQESRV